MKVLVFAHIPPPHHGQSYMVQQMLENVGRAKDGEGDELVFCHVNARLSYTMEDIGAWQIGKLFLLLRYILQAWWLKLKEAPDVFYYVPAPAKRGALYRDWLVMLLVAPLFKTRILHWHAMGLGQWVGESVSGGVIRRWEAAMTRWLFSHNELSIALTEQGRRDVELLSSHRIVIVPNGIPDPCADFTSALLSLRCQRSQERQEGKRPVLELLFLAHATRTKGLFDAVDAVALANARFAGEQSEKRIRLTVAGSFMDRVEEELFQKRIRQDDLTLPGSEERVVVYAGYVGPEKKDGLLRAADALCFASYYPNEAQPVSIIEALAYGLPVVLSRWRGLPEMVPSSLVHLTEPNNPESLAQALPPLFHETRFEQYRTCYLERYSLAAYRDHLREAFFSVAKQD